MNSPHVPAGLEAAQTPQTPQPVTYLARTPQSSSSNTGLSPASAAPIAVLLSLFGLAALAFVICRTRRRRTTSKVLDEQPSEKAVILDVEALAATCPIVPVTPLPDVRWTPQIRSISGPAPGKGRKSLPTKRARSPPPTNFIKSKSLFPDPHTKSVPPHTLSFSQGEIPRLAESSRGDLSPPVAPQALAVSGVQTRSLARSGVGSDS